VGTRACLNDVEEVRVPADNHTIILNSSTPKCSHDSRYIDVTKCQKIIV